MGVIVVFDLATWRTLFPQFNAVTDDQINDLCLPVAEIVCRNDGGGPVSKASIQTTLLNLLVAHVAQLNFGPNGNNPSGIVGRISNATQGSVSVASEMASNQNSQWFLQTPFGAQYWQMIAVYKTMRYIPGFPRNQNPWLFPTRYRN